MPCMSIEDMLMRSANEAESGECGKALQNYEQKMLSCVKAMLFHSLPKCKSSLTYLSSSKVFGSISKHTDTAHAAERLIRFHLNNKINTK